MKQLGSAPQTSADELVIPLELADKKGGDMAEFPPDLRVREYPVRA